MTVEQLPRWESILQQYRGDEWNGIAIVASTMNDANESGELATNGVIMELAEEAAIRTIKEFLKRIQEKDRQ